MLPYTPGSDGAGVVHTVGEDVEQVKVSHKMHETFLKTEL